MGNWKGVRMNVIKNPNAPWELYDIIKDPAEQNNVAASNPAIIEEIKVIAKREHIHPHILDWEFIDPKITRK